ncbi:hypothetical protein AMJ52_07710 [candidate division TA06 bacterium DG_78]|uniref:Uncharacterized protein n=1 Tax=candidate division TA06 bacterium DG_78 TaxID=1703772 RepID=A0A0S7YBL9_UNCT6|nr:MAG: hypothetical protein AMJ52_07710 [candidate division TA06 bacterium DG_78]
MIKVLLMFMILGQIKSISPNKKLDIEIVTKKTETYTILTSKDPISITVEGPTYLRVYTRIPWPKENTGSEMYKIILQKNEMDEEIITFESDVSNVTKDKTGRQLSKWRSFYIEVPEGSNTYNILHWSSPNDTILLNFRYESPKEWQEIRATDYKSIIEAIEEEKIIKYYELGKEGGVKLEITGPTKLRVITRLDYDTKMLGEQNYTILVNDNGKEAKHSLRCYKSEIIEYKDRKDIIPSNARNFYINIGSGRHVLTFTLSGTIAQSAAVRFLVEE